MVRHGAARGRDQAGQARPLPCATQFVAALLPGACCLALVRAPASGVFTVQSLAGVGDEATRGRVVRLCVSMEDVSLAPVLSGAIPALGAVAAAPDLPTVWG